MSHRVNGSGVAAMLVHFEPLDNGIFVDPLRVANRGRATVGRVPSER
jgi:hypothetical protein